jgi:O-antigen ligase
MVLNGVALSLFGITQFFTSPRSVLYWTYPTLGQVFGPFVSRNLFPFYVNCCIGLALGLLLARRDAGEHHSRKSRHSGSASIVLIKQSITESVSQWLNDAPSLWLLVATAFMVSTVAFTLSRGGMLGAASGLIMIAFLGSPRAGFAKRTAGVLAITGLAFLFAALIGLPLIEARLQTFWTPEKVDTARIPLWQRTFPKVVEFPLWGSGLGTFQYVELWSRGEVPVATAQADSNLSLEPLVYEHAHNDYLEVLIELGVPGLLVILAVLTFVVHYGLCATQRRHVSRSRGLACGLMFGLTAVAVQSFVDFGMRAPAIACIVTIICAMICGLGVKPAHSRNSEQRTAAPSASHGSWHLPSRFLGAAVCGAVLVLAGLLICLDQWRAHRVDRLQAAAALVAADEPDRRKIQELYLEAAARLAPRDATVQMELAKCRLDLFRDEADQLARKEKLRVFIDSFAAAPTFVGAIAATQPPPILAQAWTAHWIARDLLAAQAVEDARHTAFYPGLGNCLAARNACPLMPEPHLVLALNADRLVNAEPPRAYLDRAEMLAPRLPDIWYYSGIDHLANNQRDAAFSDWKKCLTLSDRFLNAILIRALQPAAGLTNPNDILEKVLPDQPDVIVAAALRLFPNENTKRYRLAYFHAAVDAYHGQANSLTLQQLKRQVQLEVELGYAPKQVEAAVKEFLERFPFNLEARVLLAKLYFDHGSVTEAERELAAVLALQPGYADARELNEQMSNKRSHLP